MPSLDQHQATQFTKLILIGDSGTGKTGSLASLVKAGYKLYILDYDNGLDILVNQIKKQCPEKLGNVFYETLRDKMKGTDAGPVMDGSPTAFTAGLKLLNNWPGVGHIANLGPDSIVVLDSFTHFSNAALNWATVFKFSKDGRAIYGEAQRAIENAVALLTSESLHVNFIMICHARYIQREDGVTKGYPRSAGTALSPDIPTYFNTTVISETVGVGSAVRRQLSTIPSGMIDTKNSAGVSKIYPIETGLADLFKDLRG